MFDALHIHSCIQSVLPCLPQILVELLLESIVEHGAVDLLCTFLSAHERYQGVQAVALRTLVLLTEDGKAVCVRAYVRVRIGPAVVVLCTRVPALCTEHRQTRTCCGMHPFPYRWNVTKICCCQCLYVRVATRNRTLARITVLRKWPIKFTKIKSSFFRRPKVATSSYWREIVA